MANDYFLQSTDCELDQVVVNQEPAIEKAMSTHCEAIQSDEIESTEVV